MRFIVKLGAVGLAAVALAAPALANPGAWGQDHGPGNQIGVRQLTGDSGGQLPRYAIQPSAGLQTQGGASFDWGDAAIGAGLASALFLCGGGLTLVVRRRHDRLATA